MLPFDNIDVDEIRPFENKSADLDLPNQHAWEYVAAHYDILEIIGEGSYGKVVKAMHKETGEYRAIKYIEEALFNAYEAKKVCREIQILRQLSKQKSNIYTVKLFDVIIPPMQENAAPMQGKQLFDDLFLIQEHFGQDIKQMIMNKDKVVISEEHIKIITYNILCATQYLHSLNIVHRDLKPGNVLVNSDCNIKICDFGLARTLPQNKLKGMKVTTASSPSMSQNTVVSEMDKSEGHHETEQVLTARIGSRFYRAPEIVLCNKTYDFAVDIWAVGCILAELLLNFVESPKSGDRAKTVDEVLGDMFLFPGDSCFPLSPLKTTQNKSKQKISDQDQLIKIFKMLGAPSQDDLAFLKDKEKLNYISQLLQNFEFENKLDQKFEKTNPAIRDLLKQLLQINPKNRLSAAELMNLPVFDDIRDQDARIYKPSKILKLPIDFENPISTEETDAVMKFQKIILKETKKMRIAKKTETQQ